MEQSLSFGTYDKNAAPPLADRIPTQFITLASGSRAFGIDIMAVREIRNWSPITELPGQPFGALGVLDIRGSIIEVYDLAAMVGGSGGTKQEPAGQVVLVVSLKTQDIGLLVDGVSDIIFAQGADLRPAPKASSGSNSSPVVGLVQNGDRLIAILDAPALFPLLAT